MCSSDLKGKLDAYPGDVFVDPSGNLALAFSVKSYPYTLLIDKSGHILFRGEGPLTEEDFRRLNEELKASAASVLPTFSFPSAAGGVLSSDSLANKIWVANFIFTSCGNVCPMVSEKLRALQEEFIGNPNFRLVSFSVDPERDLPERLLAFGRQHRANTAIWSFLRPKFSDLKELMVNGFHLGTAESPLVHTAKIVLVNKGNLIESYYDGEDQGTVEKLKTDIRALLKQIP